MAYLFSSEYRCEISQAMSLHKEEESKALIYFKHEYNNLIGEVKENLEWVQY